MNNFEYFEPKSIGEACELLQGSDNAKLLAGGVSLGVMLKNKLIFPDRIINLKTIEDLSEIREDQEGGLIIGALCRHARVSASERIRDRYGVLAEAALSIGNVPIRNMGTIGGNVCHSEPSADFPPVLIALDASLSITGPAGERTVPVAEFFTDFFENVLGEDEILTAIRLPTALNGASGAYEHIQRSSNGITVVGAAAVISLDNEGGCTHAGLGIGGVDSTPLDVKEVKTWIGQRIDPSLFEAAAQSASGQCNPISDAHASADYRRHMVGVLSRRALQKAWEKAQDKINWS